ncbi:hypothetical protein DICVIV_09178 [Dictyocaulus viviparus]|uniref:Uncharacterized protein n=1 Tax=Dictyocaulus viviparus TaxID=29172 RepID=A0A0D8XR29_DICVI|nr:hypothetical protein DICVIV_09178 [Dictyocaulus viviparus]
MKKPLEIVPCVSRNASTELFQHKWNFMHSGTTEGPDENSRIFYLDFLAFRLYRRQMLLIEIVSVIQRISGFVSRVKVFLKRIVNLMSDL